MNSGNQTTDELHSDRFPETCEDRSYECCDKNPPGMIGLPPCGEMTDAEYDRWYTWHVGGE